MNYFLKKLVTDLVIAKFDAAILWYMQLANITSQEYADYLVAKSCKVADVYDEGKLNDVFIERVISSIGEILRNYQAQKP